VPELVQFALSTGGSVTVEVGTPAGMERVGRRQQTLQDMTSSFDEALTDVRDAAAAALAQFQGMATRPDEVEITFGVKLDARLGAVIAETGVEGNFQVTVKWAHPRSAPPAST
jgi:hypothetical protein